MLGVTCSELGLWDDMMAFCGVLHGLLHKLLFDVEPMGLEA